MDNFVAATNSGFGEGWRLVYIYRRFRRDNAFSQVETSMLYTSRNRSLGVAVFARTMRSAGHQIRQPPLDQPTIAHTTTMVHEVHNWDTDSDYVDEDEYDELDQDPLMAIQDRVRPAELREMSVADICRTSHCPESPTTL